MTPPLIRLPHGSDAPSIPVRLTWLGGVPAIDVGEADEETMAEVREWVDSSEHSVVIEFSAPRQDPGANPEKAAARLTAKLAACGLAMLSASVILLSLAMTGQSEIVGLTRVALSFTTLALVIKIGWL